ncbi:MAG: hypothetical protein LBN95_07255 [Prevotellaceae bacterium]|nr:hypothetical protein [Prevotellaceae bacterium]
MKLTFGTTFLKSVALTKSGALCNNILRAKAPNLLPCMAGAEQAKHFL